MTIGGKGRPVVGRVVLDGTPGRPGRLAAEPAGDDQASPDPSSGKGPRGCDRFAANLDKDGRFRIDDVPPGQLRADRPGERPARPQELRRRDRDRPGDPARHRPRRARRRPDRPRRDQGRGCSTTLQVGDLAPDFTARAARRRLGSGSATSGASSCSSTSGRPGAAPAWPRCPRSRTSRSPSATTRGSSWSACPATRRRAGRRVRRKNGLGWTQAFAGSLQAGVAAGVQGPGDPGDVPGRARRPGPGQEPPGRRPQARPSAPPWTGRRLVLRREGRPAARPGSRSPGSTTGGRNPRPSAPAVVVLDDADGDSSRGRPRLGRAPVPGRLGREIAASKGSTPASGRREPPGRGRPGPGADLPLRPGRPPGRRARLSGAGRSGGSRGSTPTPWRLTRGPATSGAPAGGTSSRARRSSSTPRGSRSTASRSGGSTSPMTRKPTPSGWSATGWSSSSRDGKELFRKPREGWASVSVATDPADGSVWVVERAHPDVARSENRLWHFEADRGRAQGPAARREEAFGVAFDPKDPDRLGRLLQLRPPPVHLRRPRQLPRCRSRPDPSPSARPPARSGRPPKRNSSGSGPTAGSKPDCPSKCPSRQSWLAAF